MKSSRGTVSSLSLKQHSIISYLSTCIKKCSLIPKHTHTQLHICLLDAETHYHNNSYLLSVSIFSRLTQFRLGQDHPPPRNKTSGHKWSMFFTGPMSLPTNHQRCQSTETHIHSIPPQVQASSVRWLFPGDCCIQCHIPQNNRSL